jgi:hypothetical protein
MLGDVLGRHGEPSAVDLNTQAVAVDVPNAALPATAGGSPADVVADGEDARAGGVLGHGSDGGEVLVLVSVHVGDSS